MNILRAHPFLAAILSAFVLLAATYSIVTPIFEAGDEVWHYPVVENIARGRGLPIQDPTIKTLWEQEGGQPPLYYALSAALTFWIDTRDLAERRWLNPHAIIGIPLLAGNKNLVVHTSAENFPWQGTTLAVHLIRFFSIFLSALSVALTYFLALEIGNASVIATLSEEKGKQSPRRNGECFAKIARNDIPNKKLAAASAAFVAFNPMFLFISASVNNDNLAVMLATLAMLLLTRLITRGASLTRFVFLGVVLGFAVLTKVSNLGLLIVAGVVFIFLLWEHRRAQAEMRKRGEKKSSRPRAPAPPRLWVSMFISALSVILIAGWWYARNYFLYGDPLALNVFVAIAGARREPATLIALLNEFQGLRISFWGNFGGVNIIAPDWVYVALDVFTLLAAIGLLIGIARRALPRLLALPALWLAIIFLALMRWTMLTLASQGRLLFPAIGAGGILFTFGMMQVSTEFKILNSKFKIPMARLNLEFRILNLASFVPILFLLTFAALAPFTLLAPAYALPARLSDDASVPRNARIFYDDKIELIGYDLPQKSVAPNSELPITLYWRSPARLAEDFSVGIALVDADGKKVGQWDAYPGNGLYPTRLWQPGEVIVDKYRVPVAADARAPQVARVEVALYRKATLQNLAPRDSQGRAITPSIARFKIAGQARVAVENPVEYLFGEQIALVGYAMQNDSSNLRVKLFWRARAVIPEDYTVFVHVVDTNGKLIVQADSQPQRGAYPTFFWDAGELVADEHLIALPRDLPRGDYAVRVGLYRASDGARLPVRGGAGFVALPVSLAP